MYIPQYITLPWRLYNRYKLNVRVENDGLNMRIISFLSLVLKHRCGYLSGVVKVGNLTRFLHAPTINNNEILS